MRETILKALYDIAKCNGNDCQVNLGSESARVMITNKLMEDLKPFTMGLIEDIVCPPSEKRE